MASNNRYTYYLKCEKIFKNLFEWLGAMLLQNTGGLIMENGLSRFESIAAFQPVINGN